MRLDGYINGRYGEIGIWEWGTAGAGMVVERCECVCVWEGVMMARWG